MNIYFTAAISAYDQYGKDYKKIVEYLEELGHEVQADHILGKDMEDIESVTQQGHEDYYKRMLKRLRKAELLVAEVSFPSTVHVGHELTLALDKDMPVLALYQQKKQPVLFWGITSDKFYAAEYDERSMKNVIKNSIEYLGEQQDTRFNFFISPKHQNYLDWIAKNRKVPRAVFLRRLIEEDMEENEEFTG